MFTNLLKKLIGNRVNNQSGVVLALVMSFLALMLFSTVSLSTLIQRDVRLIETVQEKEQARFMAEAGINHALAKLRLDGFASRSNFTAALDTGGYSVMYSTTGGRHLVSSAGTVGGVTKTVTAELEDNTPTALNYFTGAGNNIRMQSIIAAVTINGDIHGNNDVFLRAGAFSTFTLNGDVSATGTVTTSSSPWWGTLNINGSIINGANLITFPTFNYNEYKTAAQDNGLYYSGNQVFTEQVLSPANGIVFVDGDVTFRKDCVLNGGIIADNISVRDTRWWEIGKLTQHKSGNRNVIIARDGNLDIFGRINIEEALVMASSDIRALSALAELDVNGIILAKQDITMWNFITRIDYTYTMPNPAPPGMMAEDGGDMFGLVSWNQ